MSKPRSDSPLNALSAIQVETLEGWLFDEKISYTEAVARVEKEFGIKITRSSLSRYYQRVAAERMQSELLNVEKMMADLGRTSLNLNAANVTMTLIAKRFVQLAVEKPDKVRQLAALAKVIIAHRALEIKNGWLDLKRREAFREHEESEERREDFEERFSDWMKEMGEMDTEIAKTKAAIADLNAGIDPAKTTDEIKKPDKPDDKKSP